MFDYISTSADAAIKSVKTAADQIHSLIKRPSMGVLDAYIAATQENKEDINPNIHANKSDADLKPQGQDNATSLATTPEIEPSPTKSSAHDIHTEETNKLDENPVSDFMLAFQAKLDSNDFVSAFGLILDSKEKNKPDLLRLFTTKLDKHDISIEKFIIDDYPEKFNDEILDILLIRAKELPAHHYAHQENDYFDRYWKFILDYLIQQRDWPRLNNFLGALPPYAGYYKFILTRIPDATCQQTLLKNINSTGDDTEFSLNVNEHQRKSTWLSLEELAQSDDEAINRHLMIVKKLSDTNKNFENFEQDFIKQTFSEARFYRLVAALINNNFLDTRHTSYLADFLKRNLNDGNIQKSDKDNLTFVSLLEAVFQNKILMSDENIRDTLCDEGLNFALSGKHEKLADLLLNSIFLNYRNNSSNTILLKKIQTALQKMIIYPDPKNIDPYIQSAKNFLEYVKALEQTLTITRQGVIFFPSRADHEKHAKDVYKLFNMLQSSTADLSVANKRSVLEELNKTLSKHQTALMPVTKETSQGKSNLGRRK